MKIFFVTLLLLAGGSVCLQMWFYLAHLVEERTRPFHERRQTVTEG